MAKLALVVPLLCLSAVASALQKQSKTPCCTRPPPPGTILERITQPLPSQYVRPSDLPTSFDWRNVNGVVYSTPIRNQFLPKFCGSCWAFAVTSSMSDRIKIGMNASSIDVQIAPQVLLDCAREYGAGGCDGGSAVAAHEFINKYGITDETCAPYMAVDYEFNSELDCTLTMCRSCDRFGVCSYVNGTKHYVGDYGNVLAVEDMMAEIYKRGPIVCGMYAHSPSFEDYTGGIITDNTTYPYTTHDVSVVGWGVEKGVNYWIVRNSFGTTWGEKGWFRIERGTNCLLIETGCNWAVPLLAR